ncbi:MAG: FHA domain-containing protein, partial [Pseudomonadales bacterium]|nr:FHA domain-containing protein [Pseudomonadales bacterium]
LVTGLGAGLDLVAIIEAFGKAFNDSRYISIVEEQTRQLEERTRQLEERDTLVVRLEARLGEVATEHEAALVRVNTDLVLQREQSDAQMQTVRAQVTALEGELEQMSADQDAASGRIRELEAEMSSRYSDLELQATARENEYNAQLAERDHDLRAAEEALNRLENELRNKNAKIEELANASDDWRSTIVEAQSALAERDRRIRQLESEIASTATAFGKIQKSIERLDPEVAVLAAAPVSFDGGDDVAAEGPQRLLIRSDGNTEFVHQLARRTRIGRAPDSDLQIDELYISRNHAVIMAGPVHTTLEDLDSTNGVFVNGKRVSRQTLKDGDRVILGRMHFRYSVRASVSR